MDERPKVGTAAIILREGKLLLGLRKGSHAAGVWALPGGHLEKGEAFEPSLAREVHEETGLELISADKFDFTNDYMPNDDKHYVTLYFVCAVKDGEAKVCEPHKCEKWGWFSLDDLPSPLWPDLEKTLSKLSLD